jgi:peroxiredoxin Q/BCP
LAVEVGEPFPDLEGTTHDGRRVRLADLRGRATVVYFYPKDLTPGCTREAMDFERRMDDFRSLEATVVGVSVDPPESHQQFADTCGLHFPLLSDDSGQWAGRLGILNDRGMARRTTFVLDAEGVVRRVFAVQQVEGHVDDVLAAVRGLQP